MTPRHKRVQRTIRYVILIGASLGYLFPLYWLALTSLKLPGEIIAEPIIWFTKNLTFDNYRLLFGYTGPLWGATEYVGRTVLPNLTPYLRNSLVVGAISSATAVVLGALMAYGAIRFRIGGGRLYSWLVSLRMIPPVVVAIPFFSFFSALRMINTWWAPIIAYLVVNIPFATVLLMGFFNDIPREIAEAALIDGCSEIQAFFVVILPLAAAGLVTALLIAFMMCWNEMLIASVLTTSERAQTFPVYTTYFSQVERGTAWGPAAAAGVIGMLPMFLLALYTQKHLVRGLTMGAVAG